MRTALVLAVRARPGRDPRLPAAAAHVSPVRVTDFIAEHPGWGRSTIGSACSRSTPHPGSPRSTCCCSSPWSAASSPGSACTPGRCGPGRRGPPATCPGCRRTPPRDLPEAADHDQILNRAADGLRGRRATGSTRYGDSVAAERGYLREAGNLVFHVSLLFLLVGVAFGTLFGFRGTSVVIVGQGFSNNLTQYDDFTAGGRFNDTRSGPVQRHGRISSTRSSRPAACSAARRGCSGPRSTVTDRPGAAPRQEVLEVNKPLNIGGTTVHLIGHGYAAKVTVKDGEGNVAFSGPVVFLPQDGNFTSAGAIKAPDARPERLGFQGVLPADGRARRPGPAVGLPRRAQPGAVHQRLVRPAQDRDRAAGERLLAGHHRNDAAEGRERRALPSRTAGGRRGRHCPTARDPIQLDGWVRWVKLQVSDTPGIADLARRRSGSR